MLRLLPFASLAFSLLAIVRVYLLFVPDTVPELAFIQNTWISHPYWSAPIALLLSIVAFVAEKRPPFSTVALAISGVLSTLFLFQFLVTYSVGNE